MAAALNPVERRLMQLAGLWAEFRAEPAARLLLWQLPESGLRMAECFVEAQKIDAPYATGDVFLLFKQPFVHALQYSRALKEALRGIADASAADLCAQADAIPAWPFDPAATPDTAAWFADAVRSFGSAHHRAMTPGAHLCVVLWPGAVAHGPGFERWLRQLLDVGLPARLRVLMADAIERPRFGGIAALAADKETPGRSQVSLTPSGGLTRSGRSGGCHDPRVQVRRAAIDGLALAQETFAQEGGVGPAAVFRNLMMGVVTLLEKGSADQVKAKAADALKFARAQRWADQEVALRVLVAGALLKEGRHPEAVTVYRAARAAAGETVATGHPAGNKLLLQTWFGEAAVHLAAGDDAAAMSCHDEAAVVAQRDANPILAIEAFRMAAFCAARAGKPDGAREPFDCALQLGAALKPAARGLTTLPVALVDELKRLDAPRVETMQHLKRWLQLQLDAVRDRADALAEQLIAAAVPDALARVDALRADGAERAAAQGEARLETLIAAGAPAFAATAAHGRTLLGPRWLIDDDLALRPSDAAPGSAPIVEALRAAAVAAPAAAAPAAAAPGARPRALQEEAAP